MNDSLTQRQRVEREYHDRKYAGQKTKPDLRETSSAYQFYWNQIGDVRGARVLDFGCGNGWLSIWLAKNGAEVHGIDISAELVKKASEWAQEEKPGSVSFSEMAAENLTFPNGYFDLILGSAILHHTDLGPTLEHIKRTLKSGGRAIFIEPMNTNILLRIWRKATPWRRSPAERALTAADLEKIKSAFAHSTLYYFGLTAIITKGFLLVFPRSGLLRALNLLFENADSAALRLFPSLGKYCSVTVMLLEKR